ncbi:hypothetical protein ACW2Q0_21035 [Nocardia sp. R16R-3T]
MTFTMFDRSRWTATDEDRARRGVAARAAGPTGPWTGDILVHPGGCRSRLWVTAYSRELFACGDDPDYGFVLDPDGSIDYTGTSGMYGNKLIACASLTGGSATEAAPFWLDRRDGEVPGDVLTLTTEVRVWHTTETVPSVYEAVAHRIYTDDSFDTVITEYEARIIAEGWAGEHYCPNLAEWVNGRTGIDRSVLVAEARKLWDDLSLHVEDWPHAGEPEPSIAAAAALTAFLEGF